MRSTCHPRVEVCIDLKQQGVAGYDSWGDRPLPEHSLPANRDYRNDRFFFREKPVVLFFHYLWGRK
ncbi:MAG: hypothetical protein KHX53_06090 [Bacteroides sp.]|nr:hypothetical protein [Bacteroides sp.]